MAEISRRQLRRFLLARQGLLPPRKVRGKDGVLETVRRLRCLQYDSIDIVGRNHEIALNARVAGFRRQHLWELLYRDRLLVDGWDKQMSLGPIEERKFFEPDRRNNRQHPRFREDGPLKDIFPLVREEIRRRGSLCSLDIENDTRADWSWAPTRAVRAAMEALWFRGELSIERREGSRRYYDFTDRLLPADRTDARDSEQEYLKWRVLRRIASVGALGAGAGDGWLGMDARAPERRRAINELTDSGLLTRVSVSGRIDPLYRLTSDDEMFRSTIEGRNPAPRASIPAPLDNLIWDRGLVREMFGFDYVWEVYKPSRERRWGYYVLPVLYGDRFIARFEPGRDRKTGSLVIRKWWTEPGVRLSDAMADAVIVALRSLAAMDGLDSITFDKQAENDAMVEKYLAGRD